MDSTANAVCQLTEASAQAAYLVGIADPSSTAATPGLVDQTQFARGAQVRGSLVRDGIPLPGTTGLSRGIVGGRTDPLGEDLLGKGA